MIEFLKSCYQWVAENYEKIMMVLQSSQFASLVAAGLLLWKNILSARENTNSSKELKNAMNENNKMSDTVKAIKEENKTLKEQNDVLIKTVESFEDKFNTFTEQVNIKLESEQGVLVKKLNSIIDVQSIVYSTIRDDNVRGTINSILVNAKFDENEDETKKKLKEEISSLKTALAAEAEKVKNMAEEASSKLTEIVEPTEHAELTEHPTILSNFKRY